MKNQRETKMHTYRLRFLILFGLTLIAWHPGFAAGNKLVHEIDIGGFSADLTIEFEQVVGLNQSNLGISVEVINPLSLGLLKRLPDSAVSLLSGFPVKVTIEPTASGGLSFSGVVKVELYTHDLQYTAGSPFRMYSAPLGGDFIDVTSSNASGSYRSGGTKGTFSEFILVADVRPLSAQVQDKFDRLDGLLSIHASTMPAAVYDGLVALVDAAAAAYDDGDLTAAIGYVEDFDAEVQDHSGSDIPDVWRSARDLTNVAGELRAAAATLRFSLIEANNASS